jgi:hypothetical protein
MVFAGIWCILADCRVKWFKRREQHHCQRLCSAPCRQDSAVKGIETSGREYSRPSRTGSNRSPRFPSPAVITEHCMPQLQITPLLLECPQAMSNPNGDIDLTATMPCKESISALGFRPSQSYPTFLHAYGRAITTPVPIGARPNFSRSLFKTCVV